MIVSLSIALVLSVSFITIGHTNDLNKVASAEQVQSARYSDNGLSCSLSIGTPIYIANLVPEITSSAQFRSITSGAPYVYSYTDNITNNIVIVGGTYQNGVIVGGVTQHLPPMVELGFYTAGQATSCSDTGTATAIHYLDVQVPIENGALNVSAASYHISAPRY